MSLFGQKRPTIVIVDDDATLLTMLKTRLETWRYRVVTARDGVEALEVVQRHSPDLLILDLDMPRLDGASLALRLSSQAGERCLPIIVLTGSEDVRNEQLMANLGALVYVRKPYEAEALRAAIEQALRMAQTHTATRGGAPHA